MTTRIQTVRVVRMLRRGAARNAKALRKKVAKEKNLPPYVIFQDPSLEEMATTYPTTQQEMAQINGVGMGKVQKFGRQFIDAITRYVEENEIETAKDVVIKSDCQQVQDQEFLSSSRSIGR